MKIRSIATALAVVSLATSPVIAQAANPAAKLSVSAAQAKNVRAGAAASNDESKLEGTSGILIGLLAAAAVITGVIFLAKDSPVSP